MNDDKPVVVDTMASEGYCNNCKTGNGQHKPTCAMATVRVVPSSTRSGPDSPVPAAQGGASGVRVPRPVLALLFDGFRNAGDGGIDPFTQDERATVEGWVDRMDLEAALEREAGW